MPRFQPPTVPKDYLECMSPKERDEYLELTAHIFQLQKTTILLQTRRRNLQQMARCRMHYRLKKQKVTSGL